MIPIGNLDTILNVIGLIISIGGLITARVKRQTIFLIVAAALVLTTATALLTEYAHQREIAHIQGIIKNKLAGNRWTFERIYSEVHFVPYPLLREALFLAVDSGKIGDNPTECSVSDGSILSTRVYYVNPIDKH